MKVFLTDTAKLDLIDIVDYYDIHNPAIRITLKMSYKKGWKH